MLKDISQKLGHFWLMFFRHANIGITLSFFAVKYFAEHSSQSERIENEDYKYTALETDKSLFFVTSL